MDKRYARSQLVSNTTWLLAELIDTCAGLLKFGMYGSGARHGLDAPFIDDRKEHVEALATTACQLFQECDLSKEDILRLWDVAATDTAELEEIARENRETL